MSTPRWLRRAPIVSCVLSAGLVACAGASGEPAAGKPAAGGPAPEVAARIGDRTITLEDVDEKAKANSLQQYQALYDARRQVLDEMIADILVEREAAARGATAAEVLQQEVGGKVAAVTEEDVKAFFDANVNRMGGRSLEQMSPAIRDFLVNRRRQEARDAFLGGLKQKAGVQVLLEPPRVHVEVAKNDPARGPAGAAIEIIEFSDFE